MLDWTSILIGALIGAVVTIIGVVSTILWTKRASKRRKLLLWTMSQSNIVSGLNQTFPGLESLELRYGGRTIIAASVGRVIAWNEGTEAIPRSAITSENPLRVVLPEGSQVLDVRVVDHTDGALGVEIAQSPSEDSTDRAITFSCLNAGHGFVVQVVHSGGPEKGPGIKGTLQDVEGPTYVYPYRRWVQQGGLFWLSIAIGFVTVILWQPFPKGSNEALFFLGAVLLVCALVPAYLLRRWPDLFWRPPGNLRQYASAPIPSPRQRR